MKNITFILFLLTPEILSSQEMPASYLTVNYGNYTFFESSRVKQYLSTYFTQTPSLTFNVPISQSFSINTKIIYLDYKSANSGHYSIKEVGLKEYLLFPRMQYFIYNGEFISLYCALGGYLGYIRNYYVANSYRSNFNGFTVFLYRSENDFFSTGASGGCGINLKIPNSPIFLNINWDIHYSNPGQKSMLLERSGYVFDCGLGIHL